MEEMKVEKSEPQKLETENQEKLVRKKREEIEQQLLDLPIVQYAWLSEKSAGSRNRKGMSGTVQPFFGGVCIYDDRGGGGC